MINRSVNVAVGQKRRNVTAEFPGPIPLPPLSGSSWPRLGNQRRIDGRVELLGGTRHHQDVVTVMTKVIAVLLKQQPSTAVAGADADPHAASMATSDGNTAR